MSYHPNWFNHFKSSGLGNENAEPLSKIMGLMRYVSVGYCTSHSCAGPGWRKVEKTRNTNFNECPDCSGSLYWKRIKVGTTEGE